MTPLNEIREQIAANRDAVAALPETGSVLFNSETCLAIILPDGDADRGCIGGLALAHVFSDSDRHQPPAGVPGLDRSYSDGNNTRFMLTAMSVAKRRTLAEIDNVLATIEAALAG